MLEKLRDNPRAVVAALIAAGVLAIALGSGGTPKEEGDTDQQQADVPEVIVDSEGGSVGSTEVQPEEGVDADQGQSDDGHAEEQAGPVEVISEEGKLKAQVREGDNQTVVVRQMVSEFLSGKDENISAEQKLFVETNVVNSITRNDFVNAGEQIEVDESVVSDFVDQSKELSETQVALWAEYL